MAKINYISRQLARTAKKGLELYVVSRIWHLLNDLTIKFVTQQYVVRPQGYALTDMYFPQLKLHLEIDEAGHKSRVEEDKLRQADIVNATGHEVLRINVDNTVEEINRQVEVLVERIKGGVPHPRDSGKSIWFPKLYPNGKWNNSISDDEQVITEINVSPQEAKEHIDSILKKAIFKRIVFARVKGPLGDTMYRFKGEYELDQHATNYTDGLIWRKIADKVPTYRFLLR